MKSQKTVAREKRKKRVRSKVFGTPKRPRLNVYKSNTNIYAQLVDDVQGKTLISASTLEFKEKKGSNRDAAKQVGTSVAEKALKKGIKSVVFDRSGFLFHGRVKALADAAREKGLKF